MKTNRIATKKSIRSDLKGSLAYAREQAARKLAALPLAAADEAAVLKLINGLEFSWYSSWLDYEGEYKGRITIDVESIKHNPILSELLDRFENAGFTSLSSRDRADEYSASRTYCYKLPNGGGFEINASLQEGDGSCRKVQTGTKVQEVPVYEIVCD